jgi:putative oxidoreductase
MPAFLQPYEDRIYAIMRIVVGFLFLCHGVQKVMGGLAGQIPEQMPAPMFWAAGLIELVGGALVMVGLATGWAAFVCSGQMAVAYFIAHQKDGLLPIQNRGELAALYSFVFLFIAVRGSGIWSVDAARGAAGGR